MPIAITQEYWKWYQDDAAEPTVALAAENVVPCILTSDIIRLRVQVQVSLGSQAGWVLKLQYSTDNTNFYDLGASADWNYANGKGAVGSSVTSYKVTGSTRYGKYHENGTATEDWVSSYISEMDFAIIPVTVSPQIYYFRLVSNNSEVYNGGGSYPHPQVSVDDGSTEIRIPIADADGSWDCSEGTDRYALINEYPGYDIYKYTYHSGVSSSDLFTFTPFTIPAGKVIDYVRIYVVNKIWSGSSTDFAVLFYSTYSFLADVAIGTSWAENYAELFTNPWTYLPWTVDQVNGVGDDSLQQFGYELMNTNAVDHYVSRLYIEVGYSTPILPTGARSFII